MLRPNLLLPKQVN